MTVSTTVIPLLTLAVLLATTTGAGDTMKEITAAEGAFTPWATQAQTKATERHRQRGIIIPSPLPHPGGTSKT